MDRDCLYRDESLSDATQESAGPSPAVIRELKAVLGARFVLTEPEELLVYEADALTVHKHIPPAVLIPGTAAEVAAAVRILAREKIPFAPRGAGTGLSGGSISRSGAVILELARLNRIIKLDYENRLAIVEPGVINAHLSQATAPSGFQYAPDPSSQMACTIGGNIAENSGGPHCLKYGMTTNHVLAAEVVLPTGEMITLGGGGVDQPGYDLLGLFVGSEGTFGIVTKATLRLTPIAQAVKTLLVEFNTVTDASRTVSAIIAAGILPAALEMMDGATIRAIEGSIFAGGFPTDVAALLIIEVDGLHAGVEETASRAHDLCLLNNARAVRVAKDEAERQRLWGARKRAFGAMGRINTDLMVQDAVIPRSRLPEVLDEVYAIAERHGLRVANVFHAGDGNLHPNISYDGRDPDQVRRVKMASDEIMGLCVSVGGSITGEHGVGIDKIDYMKLIFTDSDMSRMLSVRNAFNPIGLCNPGKVVPTIKTCRYCGFGMEDFHHRMLAPHGMTQTGDPAVSTKPTEMTIVEEATARGLGPR
ncbi:MAG TPA: FAD-linked oxidase C-terminal domain-containing protein [Blastocatellia bacterium]|nr:FAD-linked oxidase C-terminal domain-containing protein [Blastocatellia bacterium]